MKYRLILDFGNTLKKIAVFGDETMLDYRATESDAIQIIEEFRQTYKSLQHAILCNVVKVDIHLIAYLKSNFSFVHFTHETAIPIQNQYLTPQTLGKDTNILLPKPWEKTDWQQPLEPGTLFHVKIF